MNDVESPAPSVAAPSVSDSAPAASTAWKNCSSCRKGITLGAKYYLCSVTSCQHTRTGYRFCSVQCWDAHRATARHRDAFAEEALAPGQASAEDLSAEPQAVAPKLFAPPTAPTLQQRQIPDTETLVVVSKVKALVREQSGLNSSECCIQALTRKVAEECIKGIERAKAAGRKTLMGRDIV